MSKIIHNDLIKEPIMIEGSIEINKVINVIDKALTIYEDKESTLRDKIEAMNKFKEETKLWEIVSVHISGKRRWIQTPLKYYEETEIFSFRERVAIYLEEKVKVPKEIKRRILKFEANVEYPIAFDVSIDTFRESFQDNLVKFFLTLKHLKLKIIEMIEKDISNYIGIYEKPYSIISMNIAQYYLKDIKRKLNLDDEGASQSLEVKSFFDFIIESKMNTQIIPNSLSLESFVTSY